MVSPPPLPPTATISAGHPFFDLIEEAYQVFDYPQPRSTEVCQNCCMDARIEADFFNPPIRQLPLEYVRDWHSAAYDPATGVAKSTWAYLLPRLLEILAAGEDVAGVGLEVSLSRFDTGNRENWSKEEWMVLDRFQRMFLQDRMNCGKDFLDGTICMFSLAGWPLDNLIAQVEASSSERLALRLWNDWFAGRISERAGIWITAFWKDADKGKILEFYTSDGLHEKMETLALAADTDPAVAAKASAVASLIIRDRSSADV